MTPVVNTTSYETSRTHKNIAYINLEFSNAVIQKKKMYAVYICCGVYNIDNVNSCGCFVTRHRECFSQSFLRVTGVADCVLPDVVQLQPPQSLTIGCSGCS